LLRFFALIDDRITRIQLESILLLALWIGISWLFRGVTLLAAALSFDHLPARGWQVLSGVIIVIGGGVLIISPLDSIAILTLVAGWGLIAIGIVDVISAFQVRHRLKALTPSKPVNRRPRRSRQPLLDLEGQTEFGDVLGRRERSAGQLLDAAKTVSHGVGVTEDRRRGVVSRAVGL
jgi:Short repeat of unknown function (DUF308)